MGFNRVGKSPKSTSTDTTSTSTGSSTSTSTSTKSSKGSRDFDSFNRVGKTSDSHAAVRKNAGPVFKEALMFTAFDNEDVSIGFESDDFKDCKKDCISSECSSADDNQCKTACKKSCKSEKSSSDNRNKSTPTDTT